MTVQRVQLSLSLIWRRAENGFMPLCNQHIYFPNEALAVGLT